MINQNERCSHGVWIADHCYKCKEPQPDAVRVREPRPDEVKLTYMGQELRKAYERIAELQLEKDIEVTESLAFTRQANRQLEESRKQLQDATAQIDELKALVSVQAKALEAQRLMEQDKSLGEKK